MRNKLWHHGFKADEVFFEQTNRFVIHGCGSSKHEPYEYRGSNWPIIYWDCRVDGFGLFIDRYGFKSFRFQFATDGRTASTWYGRRETHPNTYGDECAHKRYSFSTTGAGLGRVLLGGNRMGGNEARDRAENLVEAMRLKNGKPIWGEKLEAPDWLVASNRDESVIAKKVASNRGECMITKEDADQITRAVLARAAAPEPMHQGAIA